MIFTFDLDIIFVLKNENKNLQNEKRNPINNGTKKFYFRLHQPELIMRCLL